MPVLRPRASDPAPSQEGGSGSPAAGFATSRADVPDKDAFVARAVSNAPLPVPRRSKPPGEASLRPRRKGDPALQLAGWMSFIAWMNWIWGLALADSARAGFRVMGGLNRMFGVRRGFGASGNLNYALLLFGVAVLVSAFGILLTSSLREPETRMPSHLYVVLLGAAVSAAYFLLG